MSKSMKSSNWLACYLERLLLSTAACGVRRIVAIALSTVLLQGTAAFVPAYSKDSSMKSSMQVLLPVKVLEQKFLKSVSQAKDLAIAMRSLRRCSKLRNSMSKEVIMREWRLSAKSC